MPGQEGVPIITQVPGVEPSTSQKWEGPIRQAGSATLNSGLEKGAVTMDTLQNPVDGTPQVPYLGPGDPRGNSEVTATPPALPMPPIRP